MSAPRVVVVVALAVLVAGSALIAPPRAAAQDVEAQALQIERQLLCPRCTNVRLDHCELAICADMRREIRDQLAAGRTSDDILVYFSNRYGEQVLADLPRSGFNLWLFGWVGGSIVLAAVAGGATLWRLRRTATPAVNAAAGLSEADDRWLDEQLDGEHA